MALYESIGDNDVSFEMVFVGPNEPDFALPDNFRFIKSYTKPAQCFEIASRKAKGRLLMPIADDLEFKTKRPLDRLYSTYKSYDNDKLILSCRYMLDGVDTSDIDHRFFVDDITSPIMPLCGLMSRELYVKMGGIDRNFTAVMWDLDIAMRVLSMGGEVILTNVYIEELKKKAAGSLLCSEFWLDDRAFLESLWVAKGQVHFNRVRSVEPFVDLGILDSSQGPRGRWRGSGPAALEKFEDFCKRKLQPLGKAYRAIRRPEKYQEYAERILKRIYRVVH